MIEPSQKMEVGDSYCGSVSYQLLYDVVDISFNIISNDIFYDITIMINEIDCMYFYNGYKIKTFGDLIAKVYGEMYYNPNYTCGPLIIEEIIATSLPERFWMWFLNQTLISMSLT